VFISVAYLVTKFLFFILHIKKAYFFIFYKKKGFSLKINKKQNIFELTFPAFFIQEKIENKSKNAKIIKF
jgi:hypothetical protein